MPEASRIGAVVGTGTKRGSDCGILIARDVLARLVPHDDEQIQAPVRDMREGMAGIDRQRREDGEDLVQEVVGRRVPLVLIEFVVGEQMDIVLRQRGEDDIVQVAALRLHQGEDDLVDLVQRLARRHAVPPRSSAESASTCCLRPETRTMKNSSRFVLRMARNFTRSSSGVCSSRACSKTRHWKASSESSRLMYHSGAVRSATGATVGAVGRRASVRWLDGCLRRGRAADEPSVAVPNPYHRPCHAGSPLFASDCVYGIHRLARCQPLCGEQIRPIGFRGARNRHDRLDVGVAGAARAAMKR